MSFNHYYQSELAELRQLGARFAERNPALAPFLGQAGQDPDVERLLEGFAFLTGRLRQKLDDELPELTHSLLNLLWPHYLRPLPSCAILEFDPLPASGAAIQVPRGTEVESRALDEVSCRFRTCFATAIQPLRVDELSLAQQGIGARLTLRLQITGNGTLDALDLHQLPLHLAGDRTLSQALYLALLHNLAGLSLVPLDAERQPLTDLQGGELVLPLARDQVQPLGFGEDEALLPYPPNAFRGYRHLQEYFAFPEKFLFVSIQGMTKLKQLADPVRRQIRGLEVRFDIARIARQPRLPSRDNLRLHCVPVVNLFRHDALPIRLDGKRDEYPLFPAGHGREHLGVFAVERVTGWQPGGLGHRDYLPFESFAHDLSFGGQSCRPHYAVRQRSALLHGGIDTYLAFGDPGTDQDTLSIELTCTNQNLPQRLRAGDPGAGDVQAVLRLERVVQLVGRLREGNGQIVQIRLSLGLLEQGILGGRDRLFRALCGGGAGGRGARGRGAGRRGRGAGLGRSGTGRHDGQDADDRGNWMHSPRALAVRE